MSIWKCNACAGTYNDTEPDGIIYMHSCSPTPPNAQGVQTELVNRRDENIALDARGRARDIISTGAGVTRMEGQATGEPAWIVRMRAQFAALGQGPPVAI